MCWSRAVARLPVPDQVPRPGSYRSADARAPVVLAPPAASTRPSSSGVSVCRARAVSVPTATRVAGAVGGVVVPRLAVLLSRLPDSSIARTRNVNAVLGERPPTRKRVTPGSVTCSGGPVVLGVPLPIRHQTA